MNATEATGWNAMDFLPQIWQSVTLEHMLNMLQKDALEILKGFKPQEFPNDRVKWGGLSVINAKLCRDSEGNPYWRIYVINARKGVFCDVLSSMLKDRGWLPYVAVIAEW